MVERNGLTTSVRPPSLLGALTLHSSAPISPIQRADRLFEPIYSDRAQPRSFPGFTLKKSYWQKARPEHRLHSPPRSIYASMPVFFVQHPPPGRPKPPPPPHKGLISSIPKASLHYFPSSKLRKVRSLRSENELWRPLGQLPSPHDEKNEWTVEACRNMYLTYEAGKYGVKYKDEVKDGFQSKVQGYLTAHKGLRTALAAPMTLGKKRVRGRLRLHPDKEWKAGKGGQSQVSPVVTPILIV